MKLCLRFSAHALFLAVKHKQTSLVRKVIPGVLLVISMNYRKERKSKYKRKLTLTNGQLLLDPYGTAENWMSDVKLMPDISWGDMYNYLSNSPIEYTHDNLEA